MNRTAYLLLFVDKNFKLSAGIYSERHITLPFSTVGAVVLEVEGKSYQEACDDLLEILRQHASTTGGVWKWMLGEVERRG